MAKIDASLGDPVFPFMHAAEYAFAETMKVMNLYDNYGTYARERMFELNDFFVDDLKLKKPFSAGVGVDHFTFTNGTTGGYSMVIGLLAEAHRKYNEYTDGQKKPVIIMPVPTYGYFFDQPKQSGIEVVTFERESDGSVSPEKLNNCIRQINASADRKVLAYYDSNPNNPTGHIRDEKETAELAKVFKRHNKIAERQHKQNWKYICRKRDESGTRRLYKDDQINAFKAGPPGIMIIDDMVYVGTELVDKKPASFMADKELFNNCFLLAGGSKVGLASLRAGIVVSSEENAKSLKVDLHHKQYFPSIPSIHALVALFSKEEKHAVPRKEHFDKMNAAHEFTGKLMKALVNGIGDVDLKPGEEARMVKIVAKQNKCSPSKARQQLAEGLNEVKVITSPEAGFFHLLDFSSLKGKFCNASSSEYRWAPFECKEESALYEVTSKHDIAMCLGKFVGLDKTAMVQRVSFAMAPEVVVEFVSSLRQALERFKPTFEEAEQYKVPAKAGMVFR